MPGVRALALVCVRSRVNMQASTHPLEQPSQQSTYRQPGAYGIL